VAGAIKSSFLTDFVNVRRGQIKTTDNFARHIYLRGKFDNRDCYGKDD